MVTPCRSASGYCLGQAFERRDRSRHSIDLGPRKGRRRRCARSAPPGRWPALMVAAQVGQVLGAVVGRPVRRSGCTGADAGDVQPVLLHQAADGGAALGRQVRRDYLAVEDADFQPGVAVGDGLLRGAFKRPARRAECAEYKWEGGKARVCILSELRSFWCLLQLLYCTSSGSLIRVQSRLGGEAGQIGYFMPAVAE